MLGKKSIVAGAILVSSMVLVQTSGCVVETREGYYDREHHRYWHEHTWHECLEHDEHCVIVRE